MATPKGGYYAKDGKRIPSVTTILGRYKDSGPLIKWAYKQGREHELQRAQNDMVERARAITPYARPDSRGEVESLASALLGPDWQTRELFPAPGDLYEVTKKAADAGTIAHDLIEQHLLSGEEQGWASFTSKPDFAHYAKEEPGVIERALNGYQQFRKWLAQTNLKITHTELSLKSEKHRFGGTLDGAGIDADGRRVLIDWKTSNGVYADYLLQLAAYALLLEECRPELNPQGFHLLRVAKESADFAHYHWGELDVQKESFLLMRRLYELDLITKKRVG